MATLKFRVLFDSAGDLEVFRDIKIKDDANFEVFYRTIIKAFGLTDDQMASFFVSDEEWDKGEEISLLDMSFDSAYGDDESPVEMRNVKINERIDSTEQRYILIHDFLSMWIFLIELSEILPDEITEPEIALAIGEIPEEMKETGPNRDNFSFEGTDEDPFDLNGYDDDYDDDLGFDDDQFYDDDIGGGEFDY